MGTKLRAREWRTMGWVADVFPGEGKAGRVIERMLSRKRRGRQVDSGTVRVASVRTGNRSPWWIAPTKTRNPHVSSQAPSEPAGPTISHNYFHFYSICMNIYSPLHDIKNTT